MCGSTASVYATGSIECYGYSWQLYGVECNNDFDKKCDMNVSVGADFFTLDVHDDTVIQMWNMINVRPSPATT